MFLDEISSTSQRVQRHLLRVLQEREVMRIGADRIIPVNVRVIAASNQDIAKEVSNGSFREDLFFRLNILRLKVPPLRERLEDIPLLIDHFIQRLARDHHGQPFRLPEKFLIKLQQYVWPGNVRQLQNFTERLHLLCGRGFDPEIFDELYADLVEFTPRSAQQEKGDIEPGTWRQEVHVKKGLDEQAIIRKTLAVTGNNKSAAARKLGISRTTLWKKLKDTP
jgi:transcriptional regulator with PAS, ATPase and Fis domain